MVNEFTSWADLPLGHFGQKFKILSKNYWYIYGYQISENIFKQDSKESSPRSLDKMLLKLQVNSRNVQNTQWPKFFKFSKFLKCSKFKSCQITILKYSYDTKWCNHINSCHSKDFKLVHNPYDDYVEHIILWKYKDKKEYA